MKRKPTKQQLLVRWLVVVTFLLVFVLGIFWLGSSILSFIQQRFEETAPTPTPSITQSKEPSRKPDANLVRCKDEDIVVTVSIDESTPAVSEQDFVIRTSFSYTGAGNCVRDMGAKANEVWLENSEGEKIWSTDTCPAHNKSNLVELQFGDVYQMVVTWPGTLDPIECGKRGRGVEPGEYNIYARNSQSRSELQTVRVQG
jgi:hypothetical protein